MQLLGVILVVAVVLVATSYMQNVLVLLPLLLIRQ
jgi:hypothetical protein